MVALIVDREVKGLAHVGSLLSELEDPFRIFPLEGVADRLSELVSGSQSELAESMGWWGVSRKYYSVEQEHQLDVILYLIGSAFVLGQAAITQTCALTTRLCAEAGNPAWLPKARREILRTAATINSRTGLSEIVLIDAVANYFKHSYEWPTDWNAINATSSQKWTIECVSRLGLSPESREENLYIALEGLGFSARNLRQIGSSIQGWRERLVEYFRERLGAHGF